MTPWIEGVFSSLDAPTALAFLLGILSFRWWFLGPAALISLTMGRDFALGALLLGLGLTLADHMDRSQGPWWKNRPGIRKTQVLLLMSLMAPLLFWHQDGFRAWPMLLLPWLWHRPIETWMSRNSGGGSSWIPLLTASSLVVIFPGENPHHVFLEASLGAFFLMVAWYRKIPIGLKLLSLTLGCSFWLSLSLNRPDLFIVLLGMAFLQAMESGPWAATTCRQAPWALFTGVAWSGLLLFGGVPTQMGWLPMVILLVSTQLLSQEICRLCMSSSRCRERVFSTMASRLPLLFGLIWAMGEVHPLHLVWLMLFCLGAESTRSTRLTPVTESAILDSPCRSGWEKGLL